MNKTKTAISSKFIMILLFVTSGSERNARAGLLVVASQVSGHVLGHEFMPASHCYLQFYLSTT